jgi:hypothetical protein
VIVMVRSSRGEKLIKKARGRRAGARAAHQEPAPQPAVEPAGTAEGDAFALADPSLDVAVYTCACGFVFEAPVLTSVGCPHCGDHQAW